MIKMKNHNILITKINWITKFVLILRNLSADKIGVVIDTVDKNLLKRNVLNISVLSVVEIKYL